MESKRGLKAGGKHQSEERKTVEVMYRHGQTGFLASHWLWSERKRNGNIYMR